jgi:hypothetical protein
MHTCSRCGRITYLSKVESLLRCPVCGEIEISDDVSRAEVDLLILGSGLNGLTAHRLLTGKTKLLVGPSLEPQTPFGPMFVHKTEVVETLLRYVGLSADEVRENVRLVRTGYYNGVETKAIPSEDEIVDYARYTRRGFMTAKTMNSQRSEFPVYTITPSEIYDRLLALGQLNHCPGMIHSIDLVRKCAYVQIVKTGAFLQVSFDKIVSTIPWMAFLNAIEIGTPTDAQILKKLVTAIATPWLDIEAIAEVWKVDDLQKPYPGLNVSDFDMVYRTDPNRLFYRVTPTDQKGDFVTLYFERVIQGKPSPRWKYFLGGRPLFTIGDLEKSQRVWFANNLHGITIVGRNAANKQMLYHDVCEALVK